MIENQNNEKIKRLKTFGLTNFDKFLSIYKNSPLWVIRYYRHTHPWAMITDNVITMKNNNLKLFWLGQSRPETSRVSFLL